MSDSHAQTPPAEAAPAAGKSGLLSKLLIGFFVAAVIGVECAAAYFLLPTPDEVSANGGGEGEHAEHGDGHTGDAHGDEHGHAKDEHGGDDEHAAHLAEVELGEFSITLLLPEADVAYRVDFKLGATVDEHDKEKFTEVYTACQQRFRDQVMIEVRNCELTDLTDSGLGLIKRRILEKSNTLFGEPQIKGVFFSEFALVEQ